MSDLYLEHIEISSIDEGIEIGESNSAMEYHILVRKKKLALIMHYLWQRCEFCRKEDTVGVIYLKGDPNYLIDKCSA